MLTFLAYIVLAVFIAGFAGRIWAYIQAPAPLKIAVTPAPTTMGGVVWRMFTEVVFFNSLFKGNKWIWAGGIAFHGALVLVLIRHIRYFMDPLPAWFAHLQIFGIVAGYIMIGALGFLWLRRIFVERVRHISTLSDHLILLLLMAIAGTGLLMQLFFRPDIVSIKQAMSNIWFSSQSLPSGSPGDLLFLIHLSLVVLLMIIFPFSKLMHAGGIFFCPTRNQTDNPRERKHPNPWA